MGPEKKTRITLMVPRRETGLRRMKEDGNRTESGTFPILGTSPNSRPGWRLLLQNKSDTSPTGSPYFSTFGKVFA
jgi:hypothetical protein